MSGRRVGQERLTDLISLGVLSETFDRDMIHEVLTETDRHEQRTRLLPEHVMVQFTIAMCLFFDDDYEEVMCKLVESLRGLGCWKDGWKVPSTAAITKARQWLGEEPLEELFHRAAVPVAGPGTKGAWLRDWRLAAVDGFMLDVADTPENSEEFGRLNSGPKAGAFPQVQVVGLGECGTHAVVAAAMGPCKSGEQALLTRITSMFEADMLVLADRNFYSFLTWNRAKVALTCCGGSSRTSRCPWAEWLADGSYRSGLINPSITGDRRKRILHDIESGIECDPLQVVPVRVVGYEIPDRDGNGSGEIVCLITSILEPHRATAPELAAAYHERWEFENGIDEKKTHLRGPGRVLRSKSPNMVRQEIWAFLLARYAIRRLMRKAADEADVDSDRIAFMRSVRIIRRQVTRPADFLALLLWMWVEWRLAGQGLVEQRGARACSRFGVSRPSTLERQHPCVQPGRVMKTV